MSALLTPEYVSMPLTYVLVYEENGDILSCLSELFESGFDCGVLSLCIDNEEILL